MGWVIRPPFEHLSEGGHAEACAARGHYKTVPCARATPAQRPPRRSTGGRRRHQWAPCWAPLWRVLGFALNSVTCSVPDCRMVQAPGPRRGLGFGCDDHILTSWRLEHLRGSLIIFVHFGRFRRAVLSELSAILTIFGGRYFYYFRLFGRFRGAVVVLFLAILAILRVCAWIV